MKTLCVPVKGFIKGRDPKRKPESAMAVGCGDNANGVSSIHRAGGGNACICAGPRRARLDLDACRLRPRHGDRGRRHPADRIGPCPITEWAPVTGAIPALVGSRMAGRIRALSPDRPVSPAQSGHVAGGVPGDLLVGMGASPARCAHSGLVFFLPLVYFWLKSRITTGFALTLIGIGALGGNAGLRRLDHGRFRAGRGDDRSRADQS